ncbi:hypothetical protein GCM10027293_03450 [Pontibacter aydingkolensis]
MLNDVWYHLCLTYDGITIRRYFDGVEQASYAQEGYAELHNRAFRMGRFSDGDPRSLEGNLCNVQFWSKALSLSEINTFKYQVFNPDTPDLIAQYPLYYDAKDVKGNDGIIYGTTWSTEAPYQ